MQKNLGAQIWAKLAKVEPEIRFSNIFFIIFSFNGVEW